LKDFDPRVSIVYTWGCSESVCEAYEIRVCYVYFGKPFEYARSK